MLRSPGIGLNVAWLAMVLPLILTPVALGQSPTHREAVPIVDDAGELGPTLIADGSSTPPTASAAPVHDSKAAEAKPADAKAPDAKKEEQPKETPKLPEMPKYPTVTVGGVMQLDTGWFDQTRRNREAFGNIQDGTSFRTARLWAKGDLAENVNYQIEMDFGDLASPAPGRPNFQNVFMEVTKLPVLGNIRVGRWKQPFNLETAPTSIRFLSFIERANTFAFTPFRRTGVGFYDHSEDQRWTWAASVFRSADDGYGDFVNDSNGWATAERLTHLLWYECEGRSLLHLGVGHTWNASFNNQARFRRFPEFAAGSSPVGGTSRITPNFFDTGVIQAEQYHVFGKELAWVNGPFSIQGELQYCFVDQVDGPNLTFPSMYLYGSWFLTGEHRNYNRATGGFDRLKPNHNFATMHDGCTGGPGAWEVLARISYVDVNDANIVGGRLTDLTFGINWYLNPQAKIQFNYIYAIQNDARVGDNHASIIGVRTAYDF
jgi:phosphate-selective porin OprO/OprP